MASEFKRKIILSDSQKEKLHKIWFIYGNRGKKCNHNQHRFIQNLLVYGDYELAFFNSKRAVKAAKILYPNFNYNNYAISEDCINDVNSIIIHD